MFIPLLVGLHTINFTLISRIFSNNWKEATIIPIHKFGDKCNALNYRHILILNSFSKVFDKITHKHKLLLQTKSWTHLSTASKNKNSPVPFLLQSICHKIVPTYYYASSVSTLWFSYAVIGNNVSREFKGTNFNCSVAI